MTSLPDFRSMTDEQIHAWMEEVGFAQVMRMLPNVSGKLPPAEIAPMPDNDRRWFDGPTKVVACRLPEAVVDELDAIASNTKDGRAGLMKAAVYEWLQRRQPPASGDQAAA